MRRIASGMAAVLVVAAAGSVAAQKTTEVHPARAAALMSAPSGRLTERTYRSSTDGRR